MLAKSSSGVIEKIYLDASKQFNGWNQKTSYISYVMIEGVLLHLLGWLKIKFHDKILLMPDNGYERA